jgi:hypothetical protein
VYEVPVLDWKGRSKWIKARGVSYTTPSEQRDMPEGAREAFPEIAWFSVTVSQAAGPVDMIIGRDNRSGCRFQYRRSRTSGSP